MTMQVLPGLVAMPKLSVVPSGTSVGQTTWINATGASVFLLDGASEKAAIVFRAPKTGSIRKVGFRTGTTTVGATLDVRIETVNASTRLPTGTLFGVNTNVSHVLNAADDNVWLTTGALTADAAVTKGDYLAIVIANPAASFGDFRVASLANPGAMFPFGVLDTGTQAKQTEVPLIFAEYSDGTYAQVPGLAPWETVTTTAFNSGSTPDEVALIFQVPFVMRVAGFWAMLGNIAAAGDFDVVLYDSDGTTALATLSFDGDMAVGTTTDAVVQAVFDTSISLSVNVNYRLALKPTTANNITRYEFDINSVALMAAMQCGANFHKSSRTNAGAWTQATTHIPMIGLLVDGFDDGAGGGGGGGGIRLAGHGGLAA